MSRHRLERELEELSKLVTTLALAREKNGGQGEKKKEGGEEEKKEGGEEVVLDKMDIDKKVKEKKCDRDLKKLAADLLRKRDHTANYVWGCWGKPELDGCGNAYGCPNCS